MERVLYNLHHRCCSYALQTTSRRSRSYAEHTILVLAVCCFGALLLAHRTFVHPSFPATLSIPTHCLSSIESFDVTADVTHLILLPDRIGSDNEAHAIPSHVVAIPSHVVRRPETEREEEKEDLIHDDIHFSYARHQGLLHLAPDRYAEHNVRVQYVHVSRRDSRCFGEPFVQRLVFLALGSDTVLLNWLLGTFHAAPTPTPGYIWNARTRLLIAVPEYEAYSARQGGQPRLLAKGMVIVKTSFLFFVTTTLVAFTLRETQGRMLHFTQSLQYHVRNHQPVIHLVTTHVIENVIFVPIMVGMIFFLIQCYRGDKFLAFMVLSLVWVCESFSVVR
jgi:Tumour-associated protein